MSLAIPQQLGATGLSSSMSFAYEPQAGQLQSVTDLHGNPYALTYNLRGELASLTYPAQYQERFSYDADGRLARDTIENLGSTAYPRLTTRWVRATAYTYDAQGRLKTSRDPGGWQDTLTLAYSGLGHLKTSTLTQRGQLLFGGGDARYTAVETFSFDALANRYYGETRTTFTAPNHSSSTFSRHGSAYAPATARLTRDTLPNLTITRYTYDAGGSTEFTSNPGNQLTSSSAEERATFYAADGTVRAVEWRWVSDVSQFFAVTKAAFDEYRYDALGRRIWVWSKKSCDEAGLGQLWWEAAECKTSLLRRTVWNGDQELAEIQMPGGTAADEVALYENDVNPVALPNLSTQVGSVDRNQYFGRVLYTPGRGIDQPIAVTRINFAYQHDDDGQSIPYKVLPPITTMPFWNRNGDAAIGVFTTGARRICNPATTEIGDCVSVVWTSFWSAFDRNGSTVWDNWHGTILESKRDKTNLSYNRNRYYDPQTGRFTQEDPIGLAGGLNLYGFAAGDPVNLGDPFGLRVCFTGTRSEIRTLRQGTEQAIGASITLDRENCVKSVGDLKDKKDQRRRLRRFFLNLHESDATFSVRFSRQAESEQIDPYAIDVFERAPATAYWTWHNGKCIAQTAFTYPQVIAHELAHHNPVAFGGAMDRDGDRAVGYENLYLKAAGRPERCAY